MLRVTENMSIGRSLYDISQLKQLQYKRQREATSGLRVNSASDDPTGADSLTRSASDLAELEQCQANITAGTGQLDAAEIALQSVSELLERAHELATQMANGSMSAEERTLAAKEVQQIRDQILAKANERYNGNYIFNGFQTGSAVYDTAGNFVGDNDPTHVRKIIAAPGQQVEGSVSAAEVFAGIGGGVDIIGSLNTLANDLASNNLTGIQTAVGTMSRAKEQIVAEQAKVGVYTARLNSLDSMLSTKILQLKTDRSRISDAQQVDTLSDLAKLQQSLNSAISVSSEMLSKMTLVGKL